MKTSDRYIMEENDFDLKSFKVEMLKLLVSYSKHLRIYTMYGKSRQTSKDLCTEVMNNCAVAEGTKTE